MTPPPGYSIQAGTYCLKLSMFGGDPNIESTLGDIFGGANSLTNSSGAFYSFEEINSNRSAAGSGTSAFKNAFFDPSKVSAEYVTGATLQPSALSVLVCIKL